MSLSNLGHSCLSPDSPPIALSNSTEGALAFQGCRLRELYILVTLVVLASGSKLYVVSRSVTESRKCSGIGRRAVLETKLGYGVNIVGTIESLAEVLACIEAGMKR